MSIGSSLPDPHLVTLAAGCALLLAGRFLRKPAISGFLCLVALAGAAACRAFGAFDSPVMPTDSHSIALNQVRLSAFWEWTSIAIGFLFASMTFETEKRSASAPEWFGGLLLAISGMLMASRANDLAVLFVAIELATFPVVLNLADIARRSIRTETIAQLRVHFLSSALLLYGFCLLAAISGSTSLTQIQAALMPDAAVVSAMAPPHEMQSVVLVLILAAIGCRLAIVPFQPPLADLYDASKLAAAGLLSTTSQVVGLIVGVRVLVGLLAASAATGRLLAIVLAAASMFVGSALAFKETRLKRMLAYLVVSNAGFGLIGLAVGFADVASPEQSLVVSRSLPGGVSSVLFHAVTFIVSAGGLTAVIVYLSRAGEEIEHIEDLAGIGSREPPAAICAGICLLSLAGIPPFPGFWGRLFLIASSLSVHLESQRGFLPHPNPAFLLLGLVAAGSMVMASAAWLRILATIFFNGQVARPQPAGGQPALAAAMLATTLLVGAGLLPGPLVGYIDGIVTAPAAVMTGAKNVGRSNRSTAPESGKARDVENGTGTPAPSAPAADRQP